MQKLETTTMLPEGYALHDDVMASLPPERRARILANTRQLLSQELRDAQRLKPEAPAKAEDVRSTSAKR